jgi:hypothetical protein
MKTQLRLSVAIVLSVLIMSVGCGKKTSSSGIPVRSVSRETPLNPLDYEAAEQAVELWKPTKLGDSYYVNQIESHPVLRQGQSDIRKTIFELRKANVVVYPDSLSEADKLNGLEWQGSVGLCAEAARSYCDYSYPVQPANSWSAWRPGEFGSGRILGINCEKRNGKWKIVRGVIEGTTFNKVEQSDIPK